MVCKLDLKFSLDAAYRLRCISYVWTNNVRQGNARSHSTARQRAFLSCSKLVQFWTNFYWLTYRTHALYTAVQYRRGKLFVGCRVYIDSTQLILFFLCRCIDRIYSVIFSNGCGWVKIYVECLLKKDKLKYQIKSNFHFTTVVT